MGDCDDDKLSEYFGMSKEEYIQLVEKYRATSNPGGWNHGFINKSDCEKFLNSDKIISSLIMKKLTE